MLRVVVVWRRSGPAPDITDLVACDQRTCGRTNKSNYFPLFELGVIASSPWLGLCVVRLGLEAAIFVLLTRVSCDLRYSKQSQSMDSTDDNSRRHATQPHQEQNGAVTLATIVSMFQKLPEKEINRNFLERKMVSGHTDEEDCSRWLAKLFTNRSNTGFDF